jgi:hypothetical protein
MIDSAPLAGAKTVPIAAGIDQRNYPLCTLEPSIALRPDFSCCIPRNLCLFNCPRHLTRKLRGRRWGRFLSNRKRLRAASACCVRRWGQPSQAGWKIRPSMRG